MERQEEVIGGRLISVGSNDLEGRDAVKLYEWSYAPTIATKFGR